MENKKRSFKKSSEQLNKRTKTDDLFENDLDLDIPTQTFFEAEQKHIQSTSTMDSFEGGFSQLIESTQVVKHLDEITNQNIPSEEFQFKVPKLRTSYENVKAIKEKGKVNRGFSSTQLQDDLKVFDQIESSICELGNAQVGKEIDEILNDIEGAEEKYTWTQQNFLNDLSFGSNLKRQMQSNSKKGNVSKTSLNGSDLEASMEVVSEFESLGPFYGLPLNVKELLKQFRGIQELYEWQDECLNLPAIASRKNLIYALPTSGGKTLVAEILILKELLCYKKNVIFILPYVAIVQEKVWALSPFAVALNFLVEEYASSKGSYPPRKRRRKRSVYVSTIEKALGILNSLIETQRLDELGMIVVDELHMIGESGRGSTIEALLTKVMFLNANIQVVGMSATIGNIQEICKFLKAEIYTQNFRPVELIEYVKCEKEIVRVNWKYKKEDELFVEPRKLKFQYTESLLKVDPDMIGGLVMEVAPKSSCLIFCPSKKNCENIALLLCQIAKPTLKEYKKEEKKQLLHAIQDESGQICKILKKSIQYGFAYHHSGLTSDERRIIEDGFRGGIISVICCTSTLAAGVNLPAKRVILRSPYIGREFINLARYKQMVGRAGRAGLGEVGDSIVITNPKDLPKVKDLLLSPMNQAVSGMAEFDFRGLRHLLLSCISLGIANTRPELQNVSNKTLLSVQANKLQVDVKKATDDIIRDLFKQGAIQLKDKPSSNSSNTTLNMDTSSVSLEEEKSESIKKRISVKKNSQFCVSPLGLAAIKGGFELSKAQILYDDLYQAEEGLVLLDYLHLLYLVTPYEVVEQITTNRQIYYNVLLRLNKKELQTAKMLGINESVTMKLLSSMPIKNVPERILNRFYVTLMLYDLWNEVPVFQVAEKYQISRGIVQSLMMNAATFASNVFHFCSELPEFWAFSHLLQGMSQRLSHCCCRELLPLMELPAVKQSRARQLYNAGYKNLQLIAKANGKELVEEIEFMSLRVANQLIAAAKMLLLEKIENLREEAEDVLEGVDTNELGNKSVLRTF